MLVGPRIPLQRKVLQGKLLARLHRNPRATSRQTYCMAPPYQNYDATLDEIESITLSG
jgi:hypothetical protein